jgi:hypothetical protein
MSNDTEHLTSFHMQLPAAAHLEGVGADAKAFHDAQFPLNVGNTGNHFAGAPAHASALSPGAQGNIMLFSPDSGLTDENISPNFPFGLSLAQQPMSDFTLFGDASPPQNVNRNQEFISYD